MYAVVRLLARLLLRTRYRRIEVSGAERVPADGPIVVVANHGNSLVDPIALLVACPRRVAPLAKAPLFESPLLRRFLSAVEAVPVHRAEDRKDGESAGSRSNVGMFRACRERLRSGGGIMLFPEGVSQPQPKLMRVRAGAARIALDAGCPVTVVPVGLTFEAPDTARGRLLVQFGEPLVVDGSDGAGSDGDPGDTSREHVAETTTRIEAGLRALLAEAEDRADLASLRVLRVVLDQESGTPPPPSLEEENERTARLSRAMAELRARDPEALTRIRHAAVEFQRNVAAAGLPLGALDRAYGPGRAVRFVARNGLLLLLAPVAMLAAALTWPARAFGDVLFLRGSRTTEDVVDFTRMAGQAAAILVTAVVAAAVVAAVGAPWLAVAALLGVPALFAFHLAWRDWMDDAKRRVRAFLLLAGGGLRRDLLRRRRALAELVRDAARSRAETPG